MAAIPGERPHPTTCAYLQAGVIDNLAVGFALGTFCVGRAVATVIIGVVDVTLSLAGLELGNRLGAKTGERGDSSAAWSSSRSASPWPAASCSTPH